MIEWYICAALLTLYTGALVWKTIAKTSQKASDRDRAYSVFSPDFDVEVHASKLDEVLGASDSSTWQTRFDEFEKGLAAWRVRNDFAALETAARIRKSANADTLKDTVITLLIDHSGSMRGQNMLLAAGTLTVASDLLARLGVTQEILGFTTVRWKGGLSRQKWVSAGYPPNPGRLNDVLHIIYRGVGESTASAYSTMLRPDLPKENIDGEALEWAAARLRTRSETRKHIIVVSDGAPVDDSTLSANSPDYLEKHLLNVIQGITQTGDIQLSAIGINYAVNRYYPHSTILNTPDDLGKAVLGLIEQLLSDKKEAPRPQE